jgi:hypothetical protein
MSKLYPQSILVFIFEDLDQFCLGFSRSLPWPRVHGFSPINSTFPLRILPKLSHRLLASRHCRSILPRHLAPIQRLEEDTRPAPPPSELFPWSKRHQKSLPPPLQSTQTASPSQASPRPISPLQVSKMEFILPLDHVGRNLASIRVP